ncbi:hypothetical protein LTR66_015409 [Elasticomyces elasticus]|nr:hypothetical protein LTR66_015409 [Elasticomyces elasticus]
MASLTTTFTFGPHDAYHCPSLTLRVEAQNIQVSFQAGTNAFTSSDFDMGVLHSLYSRPIIGRLTLRYTYNEVKREITVCSSDYPSADGMTLITMPQDTAEACFEHAAPCGFLADECYKNSAWNYHSQLMPGAATYMKQVVRNANDALIEALRNIPNLTVVVRELFPKLEQAVYHDLCVVFESGVPTAIYNPDLHAVLGAHQAVGLPESTFAGSATWATNSPFSNVNGSTSDPKPNRETSWMNVWRAVWGADPAQCSSYHFNGYNCNGNLIGGHIIAGMVRQSVTRGSNDVYIIPICNSHNGTNQYMEVVSNDKAVRLTGYLNSPAGLFRVEKQTL